MGVLSGASTATKEAARDEKSTSRRGDVSSEVHFEAIKEQTQRARHSIRWYLILTRSDPNQLTLQRIAVGAEERLEIVLFEYLPKCNVSASAKLD